MTEYRFLFIVENDQSKVIGHGSLRNFAAATQEVAANVLKEIMEKRLKQEDGLDVKIIITGCKIIDDQNPDTEKDYVFVKPEYR